MRLGRFVVFEGINGCGKGTQIFPFAKFLYSLDTANLVVETREPNELDENGKRAREMLASDGDPYQNVQKAVEFFALNRVIHNRVIGPLIEQGFFIISDRYWHSNFAFQHAQGISYEYIADHNKFGIRVPDLTFLLDVPVDVAFSRLDQRDGEKRRKFDSQRGFMEQVRKNYLELHLILPALIGDRSIVTIDGTLPVEQVSAEIRKEYLKRFG